MNQFGKTLTALAVALLASLLAACANLAPDYQRPAAPVAAGWPSAGVEGEGDGDGECDSCDSFHRHFCCSLFLRDRDVAVHAGIVVTGNEAGDLEHAVVGELPDDLAGFSGR